MSNTYTTNLTQFQPKGKLGKMFARAKIYNEINEQLKKHLPEPLKDLRLCTIQNGVATFMISNQALGFRAKQQNIWLLSLLQKITNEPVQRISIKIHIKQG
jgi:hypothetical protein